MFRVGGHFNPDGSFSMEGSWSGIIPELSPVRCAPAPTPAIIGATSGRPMKGRSVALDIVLEKPVLVTGLSIPASLSGVAVEQIRIDGALDLICSTSQFEGVEREGVPYAAFFHAREHGFGGDLLGRSLAKQKVTIIVRRLPVNERWRLEVRFSHFGRKKNRLRRPRPEFRTKFVLRRQRDSVPSRKSRFFAALEVMILPDSSASMLIPQSFIEEEKKTLDEMKAIYRSAMAGAGISVKAVDLDREGARYHVRQYDAVDDSWSDLSFDDGSIDADIETALSTWMDETDQGTCSVSLRKSAVAAMAFSKDDGDLDDYDPNDAFFYSIVLADTPFPKGED